MRKNVLLLHLESISQMAFWQYSAEMPTLFDLMQHSLSFSNFYTASTSSVMSMSDMLHGDSSEMDHLPVFPKNSNSLLGKSKNLFKLLLDNGYATQGVQYGSFCLGDAPNNFWGIWPKECGQFRWYNNRDKMHRETLDFVKESKNSNKPFALYFWNMNTHLSDNDPLEKPEQAYHERFQSGYRLLDESVTLLLNGLEQLDILKDTIIVGFGDHGDDIWQHGIYRGRSHIIDPYSNLCWCPFFIYDNGSGVDVTSRVVSILDIKPTLLHMLLPDLPPEESASPFSGVNIRTAERNIAFTQSIFALQIERSDPAHAITKSYAVTNGDFRLIVSSSTDLGDSGGLEFFWEQWDYANTRNLLDFFGLDDTGAITSFNNPEAVHPHFIYTFTERAVRNLAETYTELRDILYAYVTTKETEALKHLAGDKYALFPKEYFRKARKRDT